MIRQQLEVAQAKFDAGLATIVDVNTAQAALDLANSQEIAAQADLIVKRDVLEQLVGRPFGPLKPLIKEARIDDVLKNPRSKTKDSKGNPIADSVNPQLTPGQTLEAWINQAEAANFNVLAGQLSVSPAESTYRSAQALNTIPSTLWAPMAITPPMALLTTTLRPIPTYTTIPLRCK